MQDLFEQFFKEKQYLKNLTPKSISFLKQSLKALVRFLGEIEPADLNKTRLGELVVKMRESGLSPKGCNTYISGINSYLSWLYENGHTAEHLRVKLLKEERRAIKTFSDEQIKALVSWKPKDFYEWRLYAIVNLLLDTGMRIEEAFTLKMEKTDFANLLITIMGKGNKERILPMSIEMRKVLWLYLKVRKAPGDLLFCNRSGGKCHYNDLLRDFKKLCDRLKITGVRCSFHTLRHTFAVRYVRSFATLTGSAENSLLHLQRMLGHETLQMTRRYVELQPEDLQQAHAKISILNNLSRLK